LGRQIKVLCGFTASYPCDRRLRQLIEAGYLSRKKYVYGIPGFYMVTRKAESVVPIRYYEHKIRLDNILHDIAVIDTAIYLMKIWDIGLGDIVTEKELHSKDGYGRRSHQPDFVVKLAGKEIAIEVELTTKSRERFMKNIEDNFMRFETQFWVVSNEKGVRDNLGSVDMRSCNNL